MRMILYTLLPSRHHGSSDEVTSLNKCILFKFFFTKYIYTIKKFLDLDATGVIKLVFLQRIMWSTYQEASGSTNKETIGFLMSFYREWLIIFIFPTNLTLTFFLKTNAKR